MGAWGMAVDDSDIYYDVKAEIQEMHNNGDTWATIYKNYVFENEPDYDTPEDCAYWFAVADVLWEYKALNKKLYNVVKKLIESKIDLELWGENDPQDKVQREKELQKFLKKISTKKKGKAGFEEEEFIPQAKTNVIDTLSPEQIEKAQQIWTHYTFDDLEPKSPGFLSRLFGR